jgi:hypothetical protein
MKNWCSLAEIAAKVNWGAAANCYFEAVFQAVYSFFPARFWAGRGAAEDAALAEWERRGGWVVDGGYAALVPGAADEGWIGGERFNGGLSGGGFHGFSFQVLATKNTKVTKMDCERD